MKRKKITCALLLVVCISCIYTAFAHPGRTDANGGHWNRSTGTYHYHTGEYAGKSSNSSSSSTKSYSSGYKEGKDVGYEKGYKVGYEEGYEMGHLDGYDEGYGKGYDEQTVTLAIVAAISFAVIFLLVQFVKLIKRHQQVKRTQYTQLSLLEGSDNDET